jgi:hypothetical protein
MRSYTFLFLKSAKFRKCLVDYQDKISMINAIQLAPSSSFTARDHQWLKLTAPTPILEEVHSEELKAVVAVP